MAWTLGVWAIQCGAARAAGSALDGRVFIADAGERGKAADEKDDVITFANGTFHSSICDQWGYGKGEVRLIAAADQRVVVTKDRDFVDSFLMHGEPAKLLFITTGNIPNDQLVQLLKSNWQGLLQMLNQGDYVELSRTSLVLHM